MKKLFSIILVLSAISFGCSKTPPAPEQSNPSASQDVSDYFPVTIGNSWTYANSRDINTDVITIINSMPDPNNDGTTVFLFEELVTYLGSSTATMYSIKDNKVVILSTRNILGRYNEKKRPFPVELSPIGQEWRQDEEDEEYYLFKTTKSSIKYDDKSFDDCILVEQQVYVNKDLFVTKKSYYARGIGLVYVTLQPPGERESVNKKLVSCNFTDIKTENTANEMSKYMDDLYTTEIYFFWKLGEVGLENIEKEGADLNDIQKLIFNALCTVARDNFVSIANMFSSGTVRMGTYLNSPLPEYLITIHFSNKPVAVAVDKAIKIIVLSSTLNSFQGQVNVPDQKLMEGTREAAPLLSNLYKPDDFISNDEYSNTVEPLYKEFIDLYLRYGGK